MDYLKTPHTEIAKNHIAYPPGGVLLWLIFAVEILTIFITLVFFLAEKGSHRSLFHEQILHNNFSIGLTNNFLLLMSGYFLLRAVRAREAHKPVVRFMFLGLLTGLGFVALKCYEYDLKIAAGLTLSSNPFFTFYWFMTLFHLLHIFIGLVLIAWGIALAGSKRGLNLSTLEAIATFWHFCDLIWVIIFPFLYTSQGIGGTWIFAPLFFLAKAVIVIFFFMEVRKSHILWKSVSVGAILMSLLFIGWNGFM